MSGARFALLPYVVARDAAGARLARLLPPAGSVWDDGIDAGVAWLCLTHDVTGRRGCSKGYSLILGWRPPFPETTGYIIGTMLAYGKRTGSREYADRAREMGDWEIEVQHADGGVMEGLLTRKPRPSTIFNTGMVMHGWLDLHAESANDGYLAAAVRGGEFLRRHQDADGAWRGPAEYYRIPHTYNARVSWALIRLAEATGERAYAAAARRQLEWVLSMQDADGWFDACGFKPRMDPSTHGIAYTLRGLVESYALVGDERYLTAAERASEALIRKLEVLGRLPSTFARGWEPTASYECLTGTVQLGGVWLRLYQLTGDARYLNAGLKAVEHAAGHQERLDWPPVRGALAGSHPIHGRYAPLQYPNWAAKFLVDSLMLRETLLAELETPSAPAARAGGSAAESRRRAELDDAIRSLERWGDERSWLGPDPYEGLNARRLALLRRTSLGRRVLIQLTKRSPVDLRSPLGIPSAHNAVALANVVSAYARAGAGGTPDDGEKLRRWVARLLELRCAGIEDACWTYHFDMESRVFFYPKTMPNTIATAFAAGALLDAYEVTRDEALLETATSAGDFFVHHVAQTESDGGAYFGYFIGDRTPIHNANMLACGLLARLVARTGREDFRAAAAAGVSYCLSRQRPDGSWPYGERRELLWTDNFHTGYVLDALMECRAVSLHPGVPHALERGLELYRRALFLPDGTPKYYTGSVYPIDAQCVAQGIQTFARAAALDGSYESAAWRVFEYAQRRMRRGDGAYMFQRRRLWRNATPHIRWVQAPMFLALTELRATAAGRTGQRLVSAGSSGAAPSQR